MEWTVSMEFMAAQMRRWGPSLVGVIITILGLGGAPDDFRVWGNWIGDFVGGDGFRLFLVAVGIAIIAIANIPGLRRLSMAAWHIMVGADSSPAKAAPANLAVAEIRENPSPSIEVSLALGEDNWVHLEVRNNSDLTDKFVAKVTRVSPEGHTVPWSIKWRDVGTEERLILKDDVALLDLATFELPAIRSELDLPDHTLGRYRLYSVSRPLGFDFPANIEAGWPELHFQPHHIKVRIAAVNQSALYVEKTIAFGFQTYVDRGDGKPRCKPEIDILKLKDFSWDL